MQHVYRLRGYSNASTLICHCSIRQHPIVLRFQESWIGSDWYEEPVLVCQSRHSSQVSAATAYLGRHLHKEQIPAVLTLRKPSRQDSQTNALPIKSTILTVCSQEHRLSVMTQSLHLHDSMSGDLSPAQGAILIGETSWESVLRCGRKGWCFSSSWSPIYFVP